MNRFTLILGTFLFASLLSGMKLPNETITMTKKDLPELTDQERIAVLEKTVKKITEELLLHKNKMVHTIITLEEEKKKQLIFGRQTVTAITKIAQKNINTKNKVNNLNRDCNLLTCLFVGTIGLCIFLKLISVAY